MKQRLLGFFSGFPSRRFPPAVAQQLKEALAQRDSLVFVSAWPEDAQRNDSDLAGMYEMFLQYCMSFDRHCVIDRRMGAQEAVAAVQKASCVFLMGGHPGQQLRLIQDLGLAGAIEGFAPVVLGVSAGAINMAERALDTKESLAPYAGLGLANITVKPHFSLSDRQVLSTLLQISMELPICAMADDSAIFVEAGGVFHTGEIYWVDQGQRAPFSPEKLGVAGKN